MGNWMNGYLEKLAANRKENLEAGGEERIKVQHQLGKLTARERIKILADPGSFEEIGSVVREFRMGMEGDPKPSPSDGIIMGFANVNGKPVIGLESAAKSYYGQSLTALFGAKFISWNQN